MNSLKTQIRITIGLGMLALGAGVLGHLALTDIAHGEPDVTLEWRVLQGGALVILAFILSAIATLRRALRTLP